MNKRRYSMAPIVTAIIALLLWPVAFTSIRAWAADKIHSLDAHLADSYTEDLDALLEREYIRVLTTYNRTNFFLAHGKPHGFEYALLKEYQNTLNKGLTRKEIRIVFEFIPVSRGRLIPDLVAGYGDIAAAGLTVTPERQKQVDFSDPYWTGIDEVLVTHKAVAPIRDAAELTGVRVFVRPSSSYHESLLALNRGLLAQGKRPVRIVRADENLETEDILELVNSGAIARTVCDSQIAGAWAQVLSDIRVYNEIPLRQDAHIAWAIRKTSPALKASLDRFVKSHRKGTRLGNIYFTRYYENTTWIKNPLGGNAGKRLAAYNAGPVKIRRARKMTRDMQLDPNRWFRNVEIAMLKVVGQETVRYVSNINKYYVIYRNAIERVERREAAIERVKP